MDIRRLVLFSALALVSYSLMTAWQTEHPKTMAPTVIHQNSEQALLPTTTQEQSQLTGPESESPIASNPTEESSLIQVKTDVLDIHIDLNKGNIVGANLLDYPLNEQQLDTPFPLLTDNALHRYVAISQLLSKNGEQLQPVVSHFQSEQSTYQLDSNASELSVVLTTDTEQGLKIRKIFTFKKGDYLIDVKYVIENTNDQPWNGYLNTQLLRTSPQEDKSSPVHMGSYVGASYSQPGVHRFQKVTFKDMTKNNLDQTVDDGWIAMQQRYFLTAWVPYTQSKNRFYTRVVNNDYVIGSVGQNIHLSPMEQQEVGSRLYVGPEVAQTLKQIAPGLDLTIDYGWLWFISSLLFSLMKVIYQYVGNWGWAIVLVTALIKLAFYRLSATSYRSMAAMRKLQPKMQSLRERYGDDKAKLSQATMELYRQEKVNPLAGCLPLVVQIPVMIALYWVLAESVELRLAPFIFWIKDLASPDPWHVLPILMGITMLIQQKLNPAPPDPMQAKVMMFLPVVFTALFWNFPAGLVLYWTVSNALTILQQWYITHKYNDEKPKKSWAHA